MNHNRRIAITAVAAWILTGCSYMAWAQDQIDALRYSYLSVQGTARSMGFGGALGSVGGDFSSLSVNPAGIGIYRSSEMMITPSVKFNGTNSTYHSPDGLPANSISDNGTRFNISNFGAVFTNSKQGRRYDKSNWKTFSFGIGINRVADFTHNYTYNGVNQGDNSSSASEVFVNNANIRPGNVQDPTTPAYLGYQSYLIDRDSATGLYYTNVPWKSGILQQRSVQERGGISEIVLAFGGNYKEKLMLGATVGLPTLHYQRDAVYYESDINNVAPNFNNFRLNESLTTSGFGVNLKLGFIYKINDYFRIGGAFHTPTAYAMSDIYDQSVLANTNGYAPGGDQWVDATQSRFNYTLVTPWRGILSATGMLGKLGFITADYEYVNYHSMRYNFSGDFKDEQTAANDLIKQTYKGASNIRAGIELKVIDQIMVRGGFAYYGSPYKDSFNYSGSDRYDFSAGLGFRFPHTFIDIAYVHSMYKNQEQPYTLPNTGVYQGVVAPTAIIANNNNNIAVTLGFKF